MQIRNDGVSINVTGLYRAGLHSIIRTALWQLICNISLMTPAARVGMFVCFVGVNGWMDGWSDNGIEK